MLSHINIENFAIIREIDMDLEEGLNIISGETGTGKSIVILAVNMALGGRASSSLVAEGSDKARVQLVFTLSDEEKSDLEGLADISEDNQLIVTREISRSGRSISRVNGEIVNLSTLNTITSHLADIHGQYDNQTFLNSDNHLGIIDSFAGEPAVPLKARLSVLYDDYRKTKKTLLKIKSDHSEFLRKQDFLKFELGEIDSASLKPGEDSELEQRISVLQNSEKIYEALSGCLNIIAASDLEKAVSLMNSISGYDSEYERMASSLSESVYLIKDLSEDIRHQRDSASFEPDEINSVMMRLDTIDKLKQKYGGSIENVIEYGEKCRSELAVNENIDQHEKELTAYMVALKKQILALSEELSEIRKESGQKLAELMTSELQELNFSNASFGVHFEKILNSAGSPAISSDGYDKAEFLFNANKGETLKPMSEIASGGEISRISLAFKRITSDIDRISTMIFDEIDTGISGITASVVGRKMKSIAENHQIICITHLPQIAAAGDHQYLIAKNDAEDHSYTTITRLTGMERIREIARLLGGDTVTDTTLASANELLESFRQ